MDPLFPEIPEDLSGLTVDELNDHAASLRASAQVVAENAADPTLHTDVIGERSPDEIVQEMTAGAESIERINARLAEITEGEEEYVAQTASLAEKFGLTADADEAAEEAPVEPAEAEAAEVVAEAAAEAPAEAVAEVVAEAEAATAEAVAEPVVAAAPQLRRPRPIPAQAPQSHQPISVGSPTGGSLVAAAGIEGVVEGVILDRDAFGKAMIEKRRRLVSTPKGMREEVVVASARFDVPEELWLRGEDMEGNARKIKARLEDTEAITASGGLCAPLTPYYELQQIAVADRPVRNSLVGFNADRGGVIVGTPATIADIDTAITVVTAEQDAAGGSAATKGCQHIDCPPFEEVTVDVIARCLEIGNLTGRTYPELVTQWTELVMAAHARTAEGLMLDAIKGYSTAVTQAKEYGAVSTFLGGVLRAAAGMRSRHRMAPGSTFQAWFPEWISSVLVEDLENSQFNRFEYSLDGVVALLRSRGIAPTFYLDTPSTGDSQIIGTQSAEPLEEWPATAQWGIAPANSFMFVDGGELNLGLVRDSVLNSTNDYQIFAETFENVAFIGVESLWITTTFCPDGTVANPATAITCPQS